MYLKARIIISKFCTKLMAPLLLYRRNQLRKMIRGYSILRNSDDLDRIPLLKISLTECIFDVADEFPSNMFFGAATNRRESVLREFLLALIGGRNLNRALLTALGKNNAPVIFALPREWRDILEEHNFKVARVRCAILWYLLTCAVFFFGVLQIAKTTCGGLLTQKTLDKFQKGYVAFNGLIQTNLPSQSGQSLSYDIVTWYLQWLGRQSDFESIIHTVSAVKDYDFQKVKIKSVSEILPKIFGLSMRCRYLVWGCCVSLLAFVYLLRGKWWYALILNQSAIAEKVRLLPSRLLAKEYLFHNSTFRHRPLWTYEAEAKASVISLYFYSTNIEFRKTLDGRTTSYGHRIMSWPRYLVWDDYQAEFIRKSVQSEVRILVVGTIWFTDIPTNLPSVQRPGVAVFDITPFRPTTYCLIGMDHEFYTPRVMNTFLLNIRELLGNGGLLMLWKRKRDIGNLVHSRYASLARDLDEDEGVIIFDPDISAVKVIEASLAVVSAPFTSTALIARDLGKPSVYYDPSETLPRDHPAAHGIPLLRGIEELKLWLQEVSIGKQFSPN